MPDRSEDIEELLRAIPEMQELLEHLALRIVQLEREMADLRKQIGGIP